MAELDSYLTFWAIGSEEEVLSIKKSDLEPGLFCVGGVLQSFFSDCWGEKAFGGNTRFDPPYLI